jgi:hypothetical protein
MVFVRLLTILPAFRPVPDGNNAQGCADYALGPSLDWRNRQEFILLIIRDRQRTRFVGSDIDNGQMSIAPEVRRARSLDSRRSHKLAFIFEVGEVGDVVEMLSICPDRFFLSRIPKLHKHKPDMSPPTLITPSSSPEATSRSLTQ